MAQTVKRLPTMWETQVQTLGQEDLLEKEMATHSSILAWTIPWMEKPGRLHTVHGVAKSRTWLRDFTFTLKYMWRRGEKSEERRDRRRNSESKWTHGRGKEFCFAQCLNPWVGREKASKTMQLGKKGSLLLTQARAPATSNPVVQGQKAPSPAVT